MSRYLPPKVVELESYMQVVRRRNGLKDGSYVRYPDAEKGPYIIKASHLTSEKHAAALATIKEHGERELAALESAAQTAAAMAKKEEQKV